MADFDAAAIRDQLDRILASRMFARSERMRQFLGFIVGEALAGRGEVLKESVIAHHVYGRRSEADGVADPIVRVDARRLRDKLREYYADNPGDPVVIELPRGGYAPQFVDQHRSRQSAAPETSPSRARLGLLAAVPGLILMLGLALFWTPGEGPRIGAGDAPAGPVSARVRPLTSYRGVEMFPSWSPDGSQIAFAWTGPDGGGFKIYSKVVGENLAVPLTTGPASDVNPAWSPDGRWIAFLRRSPGQPGTPGTLYLVSPHGGDPRKVLESVDGAAWSPDSASLVIGLAEEAIRDEASVNRAIYRFTLATDRLERLTSPEGVAIDFGAEVAPDGGAIAFIRCSNPGRANCDVFVLESASTTPRRLTSFDVLTTGLDWMPDGDELVVSVSNELYRVGVAPGVRPERLGLYGSEPDLVEGSRAVQLAFQGGSIDVDIWRTPILLGDSGEPNAIGESARFIDSTRTDAGLAISPDGRRVVFQSNRDGYWGSYIADPDAGNIRVFSELINGQFSFSPSGDRVAGVCVDDRDDRDDICVVDTATGRGSKVLSSPSAEAFPHFAADGETLYFASDRSGGAEIWSLSLRSEAEPVRLTEDGAFLGGTSYDGAEILYYPGGLLRGDNRPEELWSRSAATGETAMLVDRVYPLAHKDAASGLYWLDFADGRRAPPAVKHRSRATGEIRELGRVTQPVAGTVDADLEVGPLEDYLYTTHVESVTGDIFYVEDFR